MTISNDRRSAWPTYWSDPGSARKRFEYQQHYRDCPWGEVAEPADIKAEREERERRSRDFGWRFMPSGIVRPSPETIQPQPSTASMAAAEKAGMQRVVQRLLKEHGNTPETHRSIETAGMEIGPVADALEREATGFEEAGHGVMGDSLGLKARVLFITNSGAGQYNAVDHQALAHDDPREEVKRNISLYMAGGIAQRIKYGKVLYPSTSDQEVIRKYLSIFSAQRDELLAEADAFTEASLRDRWGEVERVAVMLQLYGKLDAERFYQLIESRVGQKTQVRRVQLPLQTRSGSATFDAAAGTIEVIWGTGQRVLRNGWNGQYWEDLPVENADLSFLNTGRAPFLNAHLSERVSDVIGVVVAGSSYVKDGKGHATIRLGSNAPLDDLRSGVLANISVGYSVSKMSQRPAGSDDIPIMRIDEYRIKEISAVPLGADEGAQVRKFEATVVAA